MLSEVSLYFSVVRSTEREILTAMTLSYTFQILFYCHLGRCTSYDLIISQIFESLQLSLGVGISDLCGFLPTQDTLRFSPCFFKYFLIAEDLENEKKIGKKKLENEFQLRKRKK